MECGPTWTTLLTLILEDLLKPVPIFRQQTNLKKLTEDDVITDRVLSCVSQFIVASRRLQFALEILRLEYHQISKYGDEMRSDLEVCHQYSVFYVFYLVILHNIYVSLQLLV